MSKTRKFIFMILMAGVLMAVALLLYMGLVRQEGKPSGGTKFVRSEGWSRV